MSWVGVAVAVGGIGLKTYESGQVAKKQDHQLADQIRTQAAHQQDADSQVSDLINKTAQSTDTGQQQSLLSKFTQQLQDARGNATAGLNQVGNVSDDYKASGANAALGIADYGNKVADLTSRIDAPNLQRQDEQADRLRFTTALGGISRDAAGDDYLAKLKLQKIRANPWLDAAADVASAYGGAKIAGGFAPASTTGSAAGWWDPSGTTGWGGI